jgi:hypothetical protein
MTDQNDWRIRKATTMVENAQPELEAITENAVRQHGPLSIDNPATAMQFATILNEVQTDSFLLGIKLGMKTVVDVLKQSKPKESEVSKP